MGKRITRTDRIIGLVNGLMLTVMLMVFLVPLINVIANSLSSPSYVFAGKVFLFPKGFSLKAYKSLLELDEIWMGYANSLFYMIAGTAINLLMTIMAAYPLSRRDLVGRNFMMTLFSFTMFFGGGLIPSYLIVRDLGMVGTRWALLIPGALSVYNMIIARTFFSTSIPGELYEAAEIDGANDADTLLRIALPLSAPILAVLALYYAVGHWNSYFSALIYINDVEKYPLQLVLRTYLLSSSRLEEVLSMSTNAEEIRNAMEKQGEMEVLKYAIIIVSLLPMMIIYPFVQRYFIQGVMVGSLKG